MPVLVEQPVEMSTVGVQPVESNIPVPGMSTTLYRPGSADIVSPVFGPQVKAKLARCSVSRSQVLRAVAASFMQRPHIGIRPWQKGHIGQILQTVLGPDI
jgi:hypothetical protein